MGLTAEQKERILEEEKQRIVEEQYREQVRRDLRMFVAAAPTTTAPLAHPAPPQNPSLGPPPTGESAVASLPPAVPLIRGRTLLGATFLLGLLIMMFGHVMRYLSTDKDATDAAANLFAMRKSLVISPFTVPARQHIFFTFEAHEPATLSGSFEVFGGSRDISVSITDASGTTLFTFGRIYSQGRISYPLRRGQYRLVFDNRFSVVTPKSVTPNIALEF